ncbi:MAG: hypothetical protein A3E07_02465 [Candidatus Wildermuthbacteria bacterium RIFCSPHIGHO2_12_FULL_45_9]|uniref:Uncharacterized protein n=1 Tax=Candidatus Wildermuthbacteria bacterium RIFCSPHIGHO2_02_FULL_45_25 TaxID=1802450 RepID=A0A1G2QZT7_9BACT|nr:MAG: hypothetical protein A3C04_01565 [Candidatus Wildermuthbacteria bacterium RIFCSPHIGHO2_02_FULL_45_25]OHA70389.1 MAG: hypothetical protein A3E07_02465 [Candidatus Wildermuthbacteria bacterium RIFCSPHIGHO2_12_FULL_45_9]
MRGGKAVPLSGTALFAYLLTKSTLSPIMAPIWQKLGKNFRSGRPNEVRRKINLLVVRWDGGRPRFKRAGN